MSFSFLLADLTCLIGPTRTLLSRPVTSLLQNIESHKITQDLVEF